MTENLFDTLNTKDLPNTVKEKFRQDQVAANIMELFGIAGRPLHVEEVAAAYFRKFGEEKSKDTINGKMLAMSKTGRTIERAGRRGMYRLIGSAPAAETAATPAPEAKPEVKTEAATPAAE